VVAELATRRVLAAGETAALRQDPSALANVQLWSPASPSLYTVETILRDGDRICDRIETPFGIRTVRWPAPDGPEAGPCSSASMAPSRALHQRALANRALLGAAFDEQGPALRPSGAGQRTVRMPNGVSIRSQIRSPSRRIVSTV